MHGFYSQAVPGHQNAAGERFDQPQSAGSRTENV